jgi:hypothetical protein
MWTLQCETVNIRSSYRPQVEGANKCNVIQSDYNDGVKQKEPCSIKKEQISALLI